MPTERTIVALLRGINVGGRHRLPMAELRAMLEDLGLGEVRSYIQSGNLVFQLTEADDTELDVLAERISTAIEVDRGFAPRVLLLEAEALLRAAAQNPFPEGEAEPKTLHLFFLAQPPDEPDLVALERLRSGEERFALLDRVFYLHAPDGIGRSKLAERIERALGVAATARNWRTVGKIAEMLEQD